MFTLLLRPLRFLAQALTANDSPRQTAWGFTLGMMVGLLPKGNLLAIGLAMLLCAVQVNKAAGLLAIGVFSYLGWAFDDFAHRLVSEPHRLDVVVMPNLYGDILSDAAAALVGGLGLAPSGCFGEHHAYFESIHGTAPDIAGKGIANPTATMLAGAMMLDYLGFADGAAALLAAIDRVYALGQNLTPDQGGSATSHAFTSAVIAQLPR